MTKIIARAFCVVILSLSAGAWADDLTRMAQENLATLGYDIGAVDGNSGTMTIIAISEFQAEENMEVTGEVSPQLIGALRAAIKMQGQPDKVAGATHSPTTSTPSGSASSAADEASLEAKRQACLEEKMAAAQQAKKTKSAFKSIFSAVSRTASRYAGDELATTMSSATSEAYDANASYSDLQSAAKDLGISADDMEACRNP